MEVLENVPVTKDVVIAVAKIAPVFLTSKVKLKRLKLIEIHPNLFPYLEELYSYMRAEEKKHLLEKLRLRKEGKQYYDYGIKDVGIASVSLDWNSDFESRDIQKVLEEEKLYPLPLQYLLGAAIKYPSILFEYNLPENNTRIVGVMPTLPYGRQVFRLCLRKKTTGEGMILFQSPTIENFHIVEYRKEDIKPYEPSKPPA